MWSIRNPRWKFALLAALGLALFPPEAIRAEENPPRVWVAVVFGTNDKEKELKKPVGDMEDQLRHVFGYRRFGLLGEAEAPLVQGESQRLSPNRHYTFNVELQKRGRGKEPFHLKLEMEDKDKSVVETETRLAAGSPFFIRGPKWGKGQIIFVVEVREQAEE